MYLQPSCTATPKEKPPTRFRKNKKSRRQKEKAPNAEKIELLEDKIPFEAHGRSTKQKCTRLVKINSELAFAVRAMNFDSNRGFPIHGDPLVHITQASGGRQTSSQRNYGCANPAVEKSPLTTRSG